MASASGEFPSGNDGSALEVEDDFFSEEGIVNGPKRHETNGGSDLGSNSFSNARSSFISRVPLDELQALKERRRSTAVDSEGGNSGDDNEEDSSSLKCAAEEGK